MDKRDIIDCWNIIRQKEVGVLNDPRLPLINIEKYLAYFQLPPLPRIQAKLDATVSAPSEEPSFRNLTDEILVSLRSHLYAGREMNIVANWAEKLMRFCEIWLTTLKKRSMEKWNNPASTQLHLFHLTAFLLDYAVHANDIRFLNTVLKLVEIKWGRASRVQRQLNASNQDFISALLQFRVALMTEYALDQLRMGHAL